MQYDLNLTANGSQRIEVSGRFFKYVNGPGKIRVTTNKGQTIDLQQGQGVWGEDFSSLSVRDMSGQANQGQLLAGNFDFRDDTSTVAGTVNVNIPQNQRQQARAYGAVWSSTALMSGATPQYREQIITPAQNVFGVIVHRAWWQNASAGNTQTSLCAHPGTPIGPFDGDILAGTGADQPASALYAFEPNIVIPAGKGLWFATNGAMTTTRQVFYTIL